MEHLDLDYEPEEQAEADPRVVIRESGPELQADDTEVGQSITSSSETTANWVCACRQSSESS